MARRLLCPEISITLNCSQYPSYCSEVILCPPLVPSDPSEPSNSTTVHLSGHHFPPLLLAGAALVSTAILLSVACIAFLAVRSCRRRRLLLQQHQQQEHHFAPPPPDADQDDGFFDEELGQPHHVWLIRTVGLDESVIKAIDSWPYKSGEGLVDGTDCAVCLGEFKDGELLKLLPKCSHAFHVPCIDTWLRSHVNCPLCRAPIVVMKPNPLLPSSSSLAVTGGGSSRSSGGSSSGATVNNATDLGSQTLAHSENGHIELRASEVDHGVLNGNEEDLGVEGRAGIVIDPLGLPFSPPESNVAEPSDVGESGFQPVRRSVSMDSLPLGVLVLREGSAESSAEERKELSLRAERMDKIKEKKDKLRKGKKGLMGMERSLSSSGRWLIFSKHGRMARSSTILPL